MIFDKNKCKTCSFCDKTECEQRTPTVSSRSQLHFLAITTMVAAGMADLFTIAALFFFIQGSHQQNDTFRAAWDAYYCTQMIIPASIMVAASSSVFIIALYVAAFNTPEV